MSNRLFTFVSLGTLVLVSFFLHSFRISYPNHPVFDEIHFATYASDYAHRYAFIDIHPPLGKLLYAAVLSLRESPAHSRQRQFIGFRKQTVSINGKATPIITTYAAEDNFNDFPYVSLRMLNALFGVALALILYAFCRSIGISVVGSFLAAFFVVFENALLLETQLILLNGMYLVFAFGALTLYFRSERKALYVGILLGFALAVKLVAVIFVLIIFIVSFLREELGYKHERYFAAKVIGIAFFVLMLCYSTNALFFSSTARLNIFYDLFKLGKHYDYQDIPLQEVLRRTVVASFFDVKFSNSGYVSNDYPANVLFSSPWYFWPLMERPFLYFQDASSESYRLLLFGNPFVWLPATLAVCVALAVIPRKFRVFLKERRHNGLTPEIILFGSYFIALSPFIILVERSSFLYHYFPALLFSICLLAQLISKWLGLHDFHTLTKRQVVWLVGIGLVVIAGFIYVSPFTYGFKNPFPFPYNFVTHQL